MTNTDYNGWTNYATWRVNLEIFDGMEPREWIQEEKDPYDLSQILKEYAEELICEGNDGFAVDYALAFLADVNWYEIAKHMIKDYAVTEAV
jgi:hypothetical protein